MTQISQANFRRRLALALVLPLVLMSLLATTFIWQVNNLTSAIQWVDHTDRVIGQANYVQKLLVDMETGLRGYLVTGHSEFLEPYKQAQLSIDPAFNQLTQLVAEKSAQVNSLSELRSLHQQWNRYAQQMIIRKIQGGDYQSYAINIDGKQQMDTIRHRITSFIQFEEELRQQRTQTVQWTTQAVMGTTIGMFLGVGSILAVFIRRQLMAVSQTYGRALHTLQQQAEALRENEAALRRSNQRLAGLHEIDRAILGAQSQDSLIHSALARVCQIVPCQLACVVTLNDESGTAQIIASSGNGELNLPVGTTLPITAIVPREVFQQQTRYVEDMVTAQGCPPALKHLLSQGAQSYITVPLLIEDNALGELNFIATQKAAFTPEHQAIAEEVAAQFAIALQQTSLREQIQRYTYELEQRVAERTQNLQEANAELEAFSYSVSHDLRAPLRTLQGFTQALQEDYGDQLDSMGQEYTNYIVESAVEMDRLINDLLAYSRLSRAEIQIQPIDLSGIVAQALHQLKSSFQERHAVITVAEPLPLVMAHRITMGQVLTNLLDNATKFVEPNVQPQIRVWAEERGGRESGVGSNTDGSCQQWIRLWVEDNGIGIAPEYYERIFRVFERLHGVETYPGTGIGLAIVRKGMERMGGQVGVESQLEQGSRFWIELPKANS